MHILFLCFILKILFTIYLNWFRRNIDLKFLGMVDIGFKVKQESKILVYFSMTSEWQFFCYVVTAYPGQKFAWPPFELIDVQWSTITVIAAWNFKFLHTNKISSISQVRWIRPSTIRSSRYISNIVLKVILNRIRIEYYLFFIIVKCTPGIDCVIIHHTVWDI